MKVAFCLSMRRIPTVEDNDEAVQQYCNRVKLQSRLFRKAMDFVDAGTPNGSSIWQSCLQTSELFPLLIEERKADQRTGDENAMNVDRKVYKV